MTATSVHDESAKTSITVRYWASARAAAGVDHEVFDVVGPVSLAEVLGLVLRSHPDDATARVVGVCSVLVGDQPVGTRDHDLVTVVPGSQVDLLPPFAGG